MLYPVPVKTEFHLQADGVAIGKVIVSDMVGREVFVQSGTLLNLVEYSLQIFDQKGRLIGSKMFVKE